MVRATVVLFAFALSLNSVAAQSPRIVLDQFGYRPGSAKVAVLREPVVGFDAPAPYTPGAIVEVRRAAGGSVAFSAAPVAWNGGAVHAQSGDRAWRLDFSALTEVGDFFVHDPANAVSSGVFRIAPDVYRDVLARAVKVFHMQRCGVAKSAAHAGPGWADGACHVGAEQDRDCRSVLDPRAVTSRDLSGGWHDAGDYNKYVNFADDPVHELLFAFETAPGFWSDASGVPESGNGVPDLLDEVRVELEWLLRMQIAGGSVLHKVSVTDWSAASPPSADAAPRRYAPPTASATISACGTFAHAALVYGMRGDAGSRAFGTRLANAARAAWAWLEANPGRIPSNYDNAGFVSAAAEDDAYLQGLNRTVAAAWLFALTGEARFRDSFDATYANAHFVQWGYAFFYEQTQAEAFLRYGDTIGHTPSVARAIRTIFETSLVAHHLPDHVANTDPYGAPMSAQDVVWGSNSGKCSLGIQAAMALRYGLDPDHVQVWNRAVEGYAHYLHGCNPLGLCMLTNMEGRGAERSAREMYHAWFADGTVWDNAATSTYGPAPGFLTGGPNPSYAPDPSYGGPPLVPPLQQPALKSYRDWNTSWPENSWEITEPSLSYQAPYVRLLAEFAAAPPPRLALSVPTGLVPPALVTVRTAGAEPGSVVLLLVDVVRGRFTFDHPLWCADLGIPVSGAPLAHLLTVTVSDAGGATAQPMLFPSLGIGVTLELQVAQLGSCPLIMQSTVVRVPLRP